MPASARGNASGNASGDDDASEESDSSPSTAAAATGRDRAVLPAWARGDDNASELSDSSPSNAGATTGEAGRAGATDVGTAARTSGEPPHGSLDAVEARTDGDRLSLRGRTSGELEIVEARTPGEGPG